MRDCGVALQSGIIYLQSLNSRQFNSELTFTRKAKSTLQPATMRENEDFTHTHTHRQIIITNFEEILPRSYLFISHNNNKKGNHCLLIRSYTVIQPTSAERPQPNQENYLVIPHLHSAVQHTWHNNFSPSRKKKKKYISR